jgi:hypothetical protein
VVSVLCVLASLSLCDKINTEGVKEQRDILPPNHYEL